VAEATAPGGLWAFDHTSGGERCSDRLIALLGLQNQARPTLNQVITSFDGEAESHLRQATAELRNFGRRFNLLLPLKTDDTERMLQIRGARRLDADQNPAADAIWFTDVSDLIEAGKALAAPLSQPTPNINAAAAPAVDPAELDALRRDVLGWQAVVEDLDHAICVFGPDKRLAFATPAFADLFRLDDEALNDHPPQDRLLDTLRAQRQLPEESNFSVFKAREAARFATQDTWTEKLLTLPDNRMIRARVGPHPNGGLVYTFDDVTERYGSERRARMADTVRETALANLPEAVAVMGDDGRLTLANPGFAKMFALLPGFAQSLPRAADLINAMRPAISDNEADWAEISTAWRAALTAREHADGKFELPNGRTLAYTLVPLPDGGTLSAFVDVTAQMRVEQALRETAEAEAAAAKAKTQFIADVSFELRSPLNAINGFAELLRGGYHGTLNARQADYATSIRDQTQALSSVVSDIVELAAVEAGTADLNEGPVDVHTLLASLLPLTAERARAKALHVVFDCDPHIGWLRGDETRLRHALFHVLSNAIRFTPDRGAVRLSAGRDDDWVTIAISDDGIGVPKAERTAVFDPFAHASNAAANVRGPGLGLALVRQTMRLHGGTCEIASNAKRGATVTLKLPADRANPKSAFEDDSARDTTGDTP